MSGKAQFNNGIGRYPNSRKRMGASLLFLFLSFSLTFLKQEH